MEGLKKRSLIVVCLILVTGLVIAFSNPELGEPKTEQWMIDNSVRDEFDGYVMINGTDGPDITYAMDELTYNTLDPYGIVSRVFTNSETGEQYDVVLIASQSKDSFHDPRVCFSSQGWALSNQWGDTVKTKTRGDVPMTIALMDGDGGVNRLAAFLYKGSSGTFYGSTKRLKLAMFLEQLKGGNDLDGVFFRFIPQHSIGPTKEEQEQAIRDMKEFIAKYLDKSGDISGDYF